MFVHSSIKVANCLRSSTDLLYRNLLLGCLQARFINLKPRLKEFIHCDYVDSMDYGIYALTTGYIKESAMEAARVAIIRKTKSRQVNKIVSESPFTKKPLGTRMGKGKGKLDYWASSAVAGQWLFEFNCDNELMAKEAFNQVSKKLPVRVHLRKRPIEPKQVLHGDRLINMFQNDKERTKRLQGEI
nr:50S ribosomal protein L16 [Hydra vulgaris]